MATHLSDVRRDVEKAKRELLELKQRVFYNKPPTSFDSVQVSMPTATTSNDSMMIIDDTVQERYLNKYEKRIQCKKLDLMTTQIRQAEAQYYQSQKIFDRELSIMWENHRTLVKNQGMSTTLTNLIEHRLINITDRWRDIYNYRINYYLRNSYANLDHTNINDQLKDIKAIGFSSCIIIDAKHPFTDKQIQLLNRGPTYVPPCQMYISSSCPSIDEIVKKQYAPLKHQLASLFSKYNIYVTVWDEIQKKINDQFKDLFSIPIPSDLQQRALYEKKLIQSIQYSLNKNNLILRRTADNMNTFYLGNIHEFEAKANDYLLKSDAYQVLMNNDQQLEKGLKEMFESMNDLLETLKIYRAFNNDQYKRLFIDTSKVKLPYLYFLPDVSKVRKIAYFVFLYSYNLDH